MELNKEILKLNKIVEQKNVDSLLNKENSKVNSDLKNEILILR